jgi:dGTPase
LTFECREGILKHCSYANAQLLGDVGERFLKREQPGLEAQLANFADEIAYNNHDIDDGLRAGLISVEDLLSIDLFREFHDEVRAKYQDLAGRRLIYEIVRRMINFLVTDLIVATQARLRSSAIGNIGDVRAQPGMLLGFSGATSERNQALKKFLRDQLYKHYKVQRMTAKARRVLTELFNAFIGDLNLMPTEHRDAALKMQDKAGPPGAARAVADYIAGMTDRYAILEYGRLFDPAERT